MKMTGLLLWTQENKLSEKFYQKLGFELLQADDQVSHLRLGDSQITLINMREEEMFARDALAGDKGRGMYIYLAVADVNVEYKRLIQNGIQPATAPKDWEWGNREFIVKDPDGYKLCFWQKIK